MRIASVLVPCLVLSCVDPTALTAFSCDEGGHCVLLDGGSSGSAGGGKGQGGGKTGGSGGGGGGGVNQGGGDGGGAGGGGDAGTTVCDTSSCAGCCDTTGACVSGTQDSACGTGGATCSACATNFHCASAACQPLTAVGDTCQTKEQCASGACVSGVCCTSACTGACESCTQAGTIGRCTPLPEATSVASCAPYACDGVSSTCPSTCTSGQQCSAGNFCSGGHCIPLLMPGNACTSSSQCKSGFCADGVCCDGACSGSCDRCNLTGKQGTCSPAPANDPGAPACGGSVVCNGTLSDCPILCTSGCPTNTYCSGTYCSAKKAAGIPCGNAGECTSGFCSDGVCCGGPCSGTCDVCTVALGATADGTCTLLGPTHICRGAVTVCDVEERCDGVNAGCPADKVADAGLGCGTTSYTTWGGCDAGAGCSTSGAQTRSRTDQVCDGTTTKCGPAVATESQSCSRPSDGLTCGATTYTTWTACTYAATCSTTGSRTRTRTDPVCGSGVCAANQTLETDTSACTRSTDNVSCGSSTYGNWTACSFPGPTCSRTGTRTRTRTDAVCQAAACGSNQATETDNTTCTRDTTNTPCDTTVTSAWTDCSYTDACQNGGSRTRQVTTYACDGTGTCKPTTTTETDTGSCMRNTAGATCAATLYDAWTVCSYADGCINTGSRSRTLTTYTCNNAQTCVASAGSETDTTNCGRNTDGVECRAAAGPCDVPESCSAGVCPTDGFEPSTTVCKAADPDTCTLDSVCSGTSAACPAQRSECQTGERCCFPGCVLRKLPC